MIARLEKVVAVLQQVRRRGKGLEWYLRPEVVRRREADTAAVVEPSQEFRE